MGPAGSTEPPNGLGRASLGVGGATHSAGESSERVLGILRDGFTTPLFATLLHLTEEVPSGGRPTELARIARTNFGLAQTGTV